jgi:hypothetical protein
MKYAFARDLPGEHAKWTLQPWRLRGLREFDRLQDVPDDYVVIASHFAPWWSPLREYIAEGRPWIEIEYGYWGPDTPRRETRRVTYCGASQHVHAISASQPYPSVPKSCPTTLAATHRILCVGHTTGGGDFDPTHRRKHATVP